MKFRTVQGTWWIHGFYTTQPDTLQGLRELHLASGGDLDEMGWSEEVKMLQGIIPYNCKSFDTIKCVINANLS
jgi:hypothetical protein